MLSSEFVGAANLKRHPLPRQQQQTEKNNGSSLALSPAGNPNRVLFLVTKHSQGGCDNHMLPCNREAETREAISSLLFGICERNLNTSDTMLDKRGDQ